MEKKIYIRMSPELSRQVQRDLDASRITVWRAATFKSNGLKAVLVREYLMAHGGELVSEQTLPAEEYKSSGLPELFNEFMQTKLNSQRI